MDCKQCAGKRTVISTDHDWGTWAFIPCPVCNKDGKAPKKDRTELFKKLEAIGK